MWARVRSSRQTVSDYILYVNNISKHSTTPVPGSLWATRKISLIFHLWNVFHPWWCEACRVIQQQLFWM